MWFRKLPRGLQGQTGAIALELDLELEDGSERHVVAQDFTMATGVADPSKPQSGKAKRGSHTDSPVHRAKCHTVQRL